MGSRLQHDRPPSSDTAGLKILASEPPSLAIPWRRRRRGVDRPRLGEPELQQHNWPQIGGLTPFPQPLKAPEHDQMQSRYIISLKSNGSRSGDSLDREPLQEANIAHSLSLHPKRLLADKPSPALNINLLMQILSMLQKPLRHVREATIIFRPNVVVAAAIDDRVVTMDTVNLMRPRTEPTRERSTRQSNSSNLAMST